MGGHVRWFYSFYILITWAPFLCLIMVLGFTSYEADVGNQVCPIKYNGPGPTPASRVNADMLPSLNKKKFRLVKQKSSL